MIRGSEAEDKLELFKSNTTVHIYVSENENSAVQIAVDNLLRDIHSVCGCKAVRSKEMDKCSVIIGTIDNNETFSGIIKEKNVPVEKLQSEDGSFHWEAYLQEVRDGVFYIVGTDRRGTIFGIYDLCEELGVSPWYYWADVPVKIRNIFQIPMSFSKADWPSVKYRGIFVNDEEEFDDWAKLHTPDGTIGPEAYRNLFELLLRLKANYIWPAMHVNYFNENPQNGRLAEEMGVVVGTSHCDMLLRSNQNEWEPWIESKGYTDAVYDYSIEGRNRQILQEYWQESVELNQNYEVSYTMGMRGIHDSGFHTLAIDEDTSLNEEEKIDARVNLLSKVIQDQRELIRNVLGEKKGQEALKTFVPYKEVLSLYDRGLDLPDDMTLIWANDNFGHMRRYPNEAERKRSGGNGLYYHASYWAPPGTAMSYLFINSIPLAHTGNELKKSYESGIRQIWVLNVGGLKPIEQDMEFFLRYGWEAGKEAGITKDTLQFTEHWINSNFSGNHGPEAAQLYEAFAQATNVRKIEHMDSNVFSQTIYGDEAGRRLMRLEDIFQRGNAILRSLPEGERAAFFQLFLMKIHASYYTNHEYYYADRSTLSYKRGNMQAADLYVELSKRMLDNKRSMLHFYNKKMSGGKWDRILTPESFPPPPTAMYPARKPALSIAGSGIQINLWNEAEILNFSVYGQRQKWFEIGNQGAGSIPFTIEVQAGADWIVLSETEGTILTESRILVTVLDPEEHAGKQGLIAVHNLKDGVVVPIKVQVEEAALIPEGFNGYVESDGYVSIPAAGYAGNSVQDNQQVEAQRYGWLTVPGIGRYEGAAVMAWHSELGSMAGNLKDNPKLEYDIYLTQGGAHLLEIQRVLTLDSTGRIRFGIGMDDCEPMMVETDTRDEWMGKWQDSVVNNGEKVLVELPFLPAGAHRLKLYMVDRYVTITKLILYTSERKGANLGPVTSWHNYTPVAEYGLESPSVDWNELEALCTGFYLTTADEVPPLNVLYATRSFFDTIDMIFQKCYDRPQIALGDKRYANLCNSQGEKDFIREFGSGVFHEADGIVAIEAEYALEQSDNAYLTPSIDGSHVSWSHLEAETNGRTGLAMHVDQPGILWEQPESAPGMHYRIKLNTGGIYHVWMLIRHYNDKSDSCYLVVDGGARPLSEQFGKGELHTYSTSQVYYWCLISDLELTTGEHVLSILARKSQLRVDRIYLTRGDELPPLDAEWKDSIRS
ncbi:MULTISPECIES: glycosyl hydrolase 115 family protein [unclassified Paenibacillus]|uniref:glycosyl hydrolase 115 family protein n=1 Tax=unclassified Paenibacillus TaxID=185978 RepID=UPI0030F7A33D